MSKLKMIFLLFVFACGCVGGSVSIDDYSGLSISPTDPLQVKILQESPLEDYQEICQLTYKGVSSNLEPTYHALRREVARMGGDALIVIDKETAGKTEIPRKIVGTIIKFE
ncbi:MAG: hypothetical protein GY858_03195 [Candidatus Omnitrophica bacterium]|nr:hypothetical protein [Candidatus Omnitrophota bacterium]